MCIKELSGLLINRIFIINSSISLLVVNVDVGVKVIEDNNREQANIIKQLNKYIYRKSFLKKKKINVLLVPKNTSIEKNQLKNKLGH